MTQPVEPNETPPRLDQPGGYVHTIEGRQTFPGAEWSRDGQARSTALFEEARQQLRAPERPHPA
ncbi:hypothetical protein ABT095_17820 [Kitasatospora sp. NPDC002227]|uniref:hypothetical protein n=1 Tax=Kitasatospora sp. NPDC002227 TaxID=3154773 RepID=UPI00332E2B76